MPFPVTDQTQIKAVAGSLVRDLDRAFLRAQQFKDWLAGFTDANLIANWNFAQADIDDMRSAFTDAEQLRLIYQGTNNLAVAKDFRTFAKRLYVFGSIS